MSELGLSLKSSNVYQTDKYGQNGMTKAKAMLISIIMPTFNRASFIVEAVESICQQTHTHWELYIIDDGSIDNTKDVLDKYLCDKRVHYIYQQNQGQSSARNKGLSLAKGDFVCFLDSDNRWLPHKLQRSLEVANKHPEYDVLYADNIIIDVNGDELVSYPMQTFTGRVTAQLLQDNFVSMNTTMTKRNCFDIVGGFDEKDRLAEDYELWLRMSVHYKFFHIAEQLSCYRVMEEQLSTDKDKRFLANFKIISSFVERYPYALTYKEQKKGFGCFYQRKSTYELSVKRYRRALQDIFFILVKLSFSV